MLLCKHCGCCAPGLTPSHPCNKCTVARRQHGFTDHREYDEYRAPGCWVCREYAKGVDHDHHLSCHVGGGSCVRCRRGPVCYACNRVLVSGRTPEEMRAFAESLVTFTRIRRDETVYRPERQNDRADRVHMVADALEQWEATQ